MQVHRAGVDRDAVMSRADRPDGRLDSVASPARLVETLAFKVGALIVVSTVAILLWQFGLRVVGYAAGQLGEPTVSGSVVECSRTLGVRGPCLVDFTDVAGHQRRADLSNPGLFALSPGDVVPVVAREDGTVGLGGWQPLFDAGLLVVLALAFSSYAIGWWRRVLEHGTRPYDGGDPDEADAPDHPGPWR